MELLETWRWYGPNDMVKLSDIEQIGAKGIVTALHHISVGEVWEVSEIKKRKKEIEWNEVESRSRNLSWEVVESLNVHETIKLGLPERDAYIEKYIQSLRNLSFCGIYTVCYNFMPVLDWTRTSFDHEMRGGALALRFDITALAIFDLFILKRNGAEHDYDETQIIEAEAAFKAIQNHEKDYLVYNILQGVPGSGKHLSLGRFNALLKKYETVDKDQLRNNLSYFLNKVVPEAEKLGIKLCCHPDDPPFQLFGLPRIVCTMEDFDFLINTVDSPSNGITFCTGSLAPNPGTDLLGLIERFGPNIHFIHLRNIKRETGMSFHESDHLEGSVDMASVMTALLKESGRRKREGRSDYNIPFRPDHGLNMLDDLKKEIPFQGYSALGRMRGLAELRGLALGIKKTLNER